MNKLTIVAAVAALSLTGCNIEENKGPLDNRAQQNRAAIEAASSIRFSANAEIENIRRRLELTADPGLLGYIVLFNEAGSPILYEGVRGKVTSGGSRLTPPDRINQVSSGNGGYNQAVTRAPSDVGTYSSGDANYIYYWNTNGQYRQWSGHYLYSTTPIRMRVEPVVITVVPSDNK